MVELVLSLGSIMDDFSIIDSIPSFAGVSTDSRTVKSGDCFFAIAGEKFDGHDYLEDVFEKGAVCAVVSRDLKDEPRATSHERRIVRVDDTIKALGDLAREYRKRAGYKVVAITGSVGKTTTRQITHHVLSKHFKTHQSPKSFNNNIGLPFTLLNAPEGTEIVIAELGTNHPGEISYLTNIANPDIAAVINVHPAHLEGFGSLEAIAKEKMSISESLLSDGCMIINSDFEQLVDLCRDRNIKYISFSKNSNADVVAKNICFNSSSSSFTINDTLVELPLPGPGNVDNALAAWAICRQFGISLQDFANEVKSFSGNVMRSEVIQVGTLTILNDCYNANPASMKNALDILSNIDSTKKRRLVFICGDMAELGEQTESLHVRLGEQIADANIDLMLAVGKLSKIAADEAKKMSKKDLQIKYFEDTLSACNKLHEIIKDYDIILVKGSRTARLEAAVNKLKTIYENKHEAINF
ncbi:MAG: UDP-N-acetylmuramoyl-tripeptide--D-alanyl-D-alanine ligase [Sedimentisphaerales bacterium]|nr:UDP-N-acetylmuramoyl-tripeptide--D-alanyl-D-alanine ligase [Sedimentisphaerales bacterium]